MPNLGISIGASITTGPIPGIEQTFSTIPVPNLNTAIYQLSIREPIPSQNEVASYIFPISPSSIQKDPVFMTNIYDVAGSSSQNGVQRIADKYGIAPPIYTIQGTTGWQFHSTDGYAFTGLQSIQAIEALLEQYAQLNQVQMQANQPLYTLEFYDYFKQEFWQVEPIGRQSISQNSQRPLLFDYTFRLACIRPLNAVSPTSLNDPVASLFSTPAVQAQASLNVQIGVSLNNYVNVTPAGVLLLQNPTAVAQF